jgi:hypothetical protein
MIEWRILVGEPRVAIVSFWSRIRGDPWMTEEAAKANRRRSLIEDNPTSG